MSPRSAQRLRILHKAGYIHRDISISNILTNELGFARLGDLEYAISTNSDAPLHPVRTAMAYFMAVEVEMDTYQCNISRSRIKTSKAPPLPNCHELVEEIRNRSDNSLRRSPRLAERTRLKSCTRPHQDSAEQPPTTTRRFQHNALHDLGSLWWVAVYFTFKRGPLSLEEDDDACRLREASRKMFIKRWHAFFGVDFVTHCKSLPKVLQPIGTRLENMRIELTCRYYNFSDDPSSIDYTALESFYDTMANIFKDLASMCGKENIIMRPWDQDDDATFFNTISRERDTAGAQASQDDNPPSQSDHMQIVNDEVSVTSGTLTRTSKALYYIGKRPRSTSESTDDEDDGAPPAKKVKTSGRTAPAYVGRRPAARHFAVRR